MNYFSQEVSELIHQYISNGYDTRIVKDNGETILEAFSDNSVIMLAYYDKSINEWSKVSVKPTMPLEDKKEYDIKRTILDNSLIMKTEVNNMSIKNITESCSACGGWGTIVDESKKCPTCNGNGYIIRKYQTHCNMTRLECTWGGDCKYCPDSEEIV